MAQNATQQRLIAERVRALAVVSLTRRADLIVTEETADIGVDLWVTLNPEGKEGHRKFGFALRGVWTAVTADHAHKVLAPSMQKMLRSGPFPFPVVLFFFTMENHEGWYTWAAEPVVSPGGLRACPAWRGVLSSAPLGSDRRHRRSGRSMVRRILRESDSRDSREEAEQVVSLITSLPHRVIRPGGKGGIVPNRSRGTLTLCSRAAWLLFGVSA